MKNILENKYNSTAVEDGQYLSWVKEGHFEANDPSKKPFTIVIPPPNVTGKLHLGHAWDVSLQDIIARFKRMQGYDMLWLPGMDHAGIATQAKVDARLKESGISRYDIGREAFLDKAWEWKEEYARHIRAQWAKMGLSLDYTRERFTLDEGLNKAVNKVFIDLYNKGLIYRGTRPINWDPAAQTALSNIEVIHKTEQGKMYYLKYFFEDNPSEFLEIATTRLETLASDTAVVVHPNDERYKDIVGKRVITPFRKEAVPIITDEYIDMEFGSGAMKCSAHGNGDYEILMKNNLPVRESINPDGLLNEHALEFEGMDRITGRLAIADKLQKEGLISRVEDHTNEVGHSERTDAIVEIMVMPQWFVKMEPLAQQVLEWQQDSENKVNFVPDRFESILTNWMTNIQDWCVSRQIWWGHRIPAWYKDDKVKVQVECPGDGWVQDEDVLDTWFSSALWPFSTLGWPEKIEDIARFFPTDVLVTGYDIIFFWVSRMVFQSIEFMHDRPFKHVLIHGLIRDSEGRKMSKSLGNGVDPMEVIDQYGADALRFFLTTNSAPGLDLRYSEEKMDASWNFINKLWNASRFVLMNIDENFESKELKSSDLSAIDLWICERFDETLDKVTAAMEKFEFSLAGGFLYDFVWNDYCSWYIELSKANLNSDDEKLKEGTKQTLVSVLRNILKLLHPSIPFVTEKIYENFEEGALCVASWPDAYNFKNETALKDVSELISLVSDIRALRTEYDIKPSQPLEIKLENNKFSFGEHLEKLVKTTILSDLSGDLMVRPIVGGSYSIDGSKLIDKEAEKARLDKDLKRLEAEIKRSEGMLNNPKFVNNAPVAKLDEEKAKFEEYKRQYEVVKEALNKF